MIPQIEGLLAVVEVIVWVGLLLPIAVSFLFGLLKLIEYWLIGN